MDHEIGSQIVGIILIALIYMWGDLAGVDKVTLFIIGALFLVLFVVLGMIVWRFLGKKTKLNRGLVGFLSCCISLTVIILIMLIWILIVKYA